MKTTVVTGAAGGIGAAICQVLADEGHELIAIDVSLAAVQAATKHLKTVVYPIACDLAEPNNVSQLFTREELPWHIVTGLVNCAGVAIGQDIFELSLEDWQRDLAINLTAPFLFTKHLVKTMKNHQTMGSIVNISSLAGIQGAKKPNYAASKAGLIGLTKATALRAGQYGIRCNAIYPGAVNTSLIADWDEAKMQHIASQTPLGRIAEPREIAELVAFLLSEKSSFMTGAVLNITGGQYLGQ